VQGDAGGEEPTEIPDRPTEGELGKLIPWHKDAIHISVVWPRARPPQLCFWMRPAEYRGSDVVDATQLPIGVLRPEFRQSVFGGYAFSNTLDASVQSRIHADISMENTLASVPVQGSAAGSPLRARENRVRRQIRGRVMLELGHDDNGNDNESDSDHD